MEINATFYRLPKSSTVESWHDRAPDRFRFAVKGSRHVTHNKKLRDPVEPIETVTARLAPLRAFHGLADDDGQRYRYDYSGGELAPWVERLRAAAAEGRDGWVYFNNDHEANAPRNAVTLIDLLEPWS